MPFSANGRKNTKSRHGHSWQDLFPEGREIYYEGSEPDTFRTEIRDEFGFDPGASPGWGDLYDGKPSYRFHCPPECLNDIYGSGRWPMGS